MSLPPAFHESLPCESQHPIPPTSRQKTEPPANQDKKKKKDIDPKPTPEALAAARALIAAEPPSSNPTALQPGREPTFTPAMTTELDRIASNTPLTTLSLSRYEAQETPEQDAPTSRLLEVLSNAYVSDAYLSIRRANLELLDRSGKNAWLLGNYQLEDELRQLERELADTKREIDVVNLERQRRQEDVKGEMEMLEQTWRTGVGRVLETEVAVEELREQIREEMRRRAG